MSESFQKIKAREESLLLKTYNRYPLSVVKAKGSRLWDLDGKEYVDLLAGIAVTALGHCNEEIAEVISTQAHKLIHIGNLFYQEEHLDYAEKLLATAKLHKAFFCNSGTEANEAAIKLVRRYQQKVKNKDAFEIITLTNCFHGRTFGALSATGKYTDGFAPLVPGFKQVPAGDLAALEAAIGPQTAAVLIELVQGEGGIVVLDKDYAKGVEQLCRDNDLVLIVDEIQTGLARSGKMWSFQKFGLKPDVITSAKSLANGLPLGAMMTTDDLAQGFDHGSHGTTFGGGALVTAVASKVLEIIKRDNLAVQADYLGVKAKAMFRAVGEATPGKIRDVRGMGLLLGIELEMEPDRAKQVWQSLLDKGFVLNLAHGNVLRLLPALNIPLSDLEDFAKALQDVLG